MIVPDASRVLAGTITDGGASPGQRKAFVWQSEWRKRRNIPPVAMVINPTQVRFQQGKRIQRQDTIGGVTYFHFSNQFGQNNDILTLQLSGTTGNIDPRSIARQVTQSVQASATDAVDQVGALNKLKAWTSFYQMTLEPALDMEWNVPNVVTLTYQSVLFPKPITLSGFFLNVLQFSEIASDPFQRQWDVQFVVQSTEPKMDTVLRHLTNYLIDTSGITREAPTVAPLFPGFTVA